MNKQTLRVHRLLIFNVRGNGIRTKSESFLGVECSSLDKMRPVHRVGTLVSKHLIKRNNGHIHQTESNRALYLFWKINISLWREYFNFAPLFIAKQPHKGQGIYKAVHLPYCTSFSLAIFLEFINARTSCCFERAP